MNAECPCAETDTLDHLASQELLESERAWDQWMQEVCAVLDAQSPQLERRPVPSFGKQFVACLQDD